MENKMKQPKVQWSKAQIATLRYIKKHGCTPEMLYGARQGTIWSLAYAGVLNASGITDKGLQVLEEFDNVELAARMHRADLTERVARLLRLVRFRNSKEAA
jgi:hypothetical protein